MSAYSLEKHKTESETQMNEQRDTMPSESLEQMKREGWASIEEQQQYWIDKEAKENNEDLMFRYHNEPRFHRFVQEMIAHAIHRMQRDTSHLNNPDATMADSKPEDLSRTEATCDWFDNRIEGREWSLRDEGRNPDGSGLSYGERNA